MVAHQEVAACLVHGMGTAICRFRAPRAALIPRVSHWEDPVQHHLHETYSLCSQDAFSSSLPAVKSFPEDSPPRRGVSLST